MKRWKRKVEEMHYKEVEVEANTIDEAEAKFQRGDWDSEHTYDINTYDEHEWQEVTE